MPLCIRNIEVSIFNKMYIISYIIKKTCFYSIFNYIKDKISIKYLLYLNKLKRKIISILDNSFLNFSISLIILFQKNSLKMKKNYDK